MTPEEFQRVDAVFQRAVALPPADRSPYLDETCEGQPRVRTEVERLLARNAVPHRLLDLEPPPPEPPAFPVQGPSQVGPYRILGVLGTGAMGVVYRAEQESPRRLVALKLMRAGFASPRALRRFRREAELLGRLQHPGVAHVIEAGTTAVAGGATGLGDAQPYIVMELVDGRPLLEHVRHHDLSVSARVELIVRVCEAVEHAHLSGIVHRDLKPANILVTEDGTTSSRSTRDASPVGQPKVLDFGVARIVDADRAALTMHTSAGELIGTLPYMSPEQIAGDPDSVDTRCDVYALGVLLFEVLTGRRPHDLAGKSFTEAARIICDQPPTSLRAVDRRLRGDLDTIVTTATARELGRRYASVGLLAGDLRRYLADEPILARPPTTLYQLRKFARRNRGLVTGLVAAVVILAGGLVTSAALYARAERRAELMRRALYAQRITLGQNALESGDVREVSALLEACPTDLRHWEWRRLRLLADGSERTLRGHTGHVNDVAFTADGRFVVTAGGYDETTRPEDRERWARVWRVDDGAELQVVRGHANPVQSVAVGPDGRTLATLSRTKSSYREPNDGWVRLWDRTSGAKIAELPVHPTLGGGLCFTHDGIGLIVGGALGHAALIDVARWEIAWAQGAPDLVTDVALTPDGRSIVASHYSGTVSVRDTRTGDVRWSRRPHGTMVLRSIAISPDGETIATASKDRTVKLLDLETGDERRTLPEVGAVVAAVAFSPDGRLVSGAADGVVRVYDPATGTQERVLLGHEDTVTSLSFAPDGSCLASASRDGTAKLWRLDAPPPDLMRRPHGPNEVNCAIWSPDGTRIVTAGDDAHARVMDARTGVELMALAHEDRFVIAADWSVDGTRLMSMDNRGALRLWDAATGSQLVAWQGHDTWSWRACFSPDGRLVASGARGQIRIWDGATGDLVHRLDPGRADVAALAWSPDAAVLAGADIDGVVTLWDVRKGTKLSTLARLGLAVNALSFHPDGAWLAVGDDAGIVTLFDWARPRRIFTAEVHAAACESVAFSPDGARLLTGGSDGWVRLVESRSGDHLMTLKQHRSGVLWAAFSPDGTRIASTSRDFTARIWRAVE